MDAGSWIVFFLAVAAWISVREVFSLTETQRRGMWASTVVLMAIPAFTGLSQAHLVINVLWPFLAGIMVGELAWWKFKKWRAKREASKQAAKQAAKQAERDRLKAKKES